MTFTNLPYLSSYNLQIIWLMRRKNKKFFFFILHIVLYDTDRIRRRGIFVAFRWNMEMKSSHTYCYRESHAGKNHTNNCFHESRELDAVKHLKYQKAQKRQSKQKHFWCDHRRTVAGLGIAKVARLQRITVHGVHFALHHFARIKILGFGKLTASYHHVLLSN